MAYPNPETSFERLLTIKDHAMQHGLSIVIEELMEEADYQQYIMFVQYLFLQQEGSRQANADR